MQKNFVIKTGNKDSKKKNREKQTIVKEKNDVVRVSNVFSKRTFSLACYS